MPGVPLSEEPCALAWTYEPAEGRELRAATVVDHEGQLHTIECTPLSWVEDVDCEHVALARSGAVLYRRALDGAGTPSMMRVGDRLVFVVMPFVVEARRPRDGALLWRTDVTSAAGMQGLEPGDGAIRGLAARGSEVLLSVSANLVHIQRLVEGQYLRLDSASGAVLGARAIPSLVEGSYYYNRPGRLGVSGDGDVWVLNRADFDGASMLRHLDGPQGSPWAKMEGPCQPDGFSGISREALATWTGGDYGGSFVYAPELLERYSEDEAFRRCSGLSNGGTVGGVLVLPGRMIGMTHPAGVESVRIDEASLACMTPDPRRHLPIEWQRPLLDDEDPDAARVWDHGDLVASDQETLFFIHNEPKPRLQELSVHSGERAFSCTLPEDVRYGSYNVALTDGLLVQATMASNSSRWTGLRAVRVPGRDQAREGWVSWGGSNARDNQELVPLR